MSTDKDKDIDVVDLDDKHVKIMEAMLPFAKSTTQKNLTTVNIHASTRKSKVLLILLPEWAVSFPPYNLARLVSVLRHAGYNAKSLDLNIQAYREYKDWGVDFDPWHGSKEWRWMENSYHEHLHKYMEPLMEKYLKIIESEKYTVVGFCLYYCNQAPTDWMAEQIKKRLPHVITMVGGPQCHAFPPDKWYYDYVISGEGEKMILEVMEEIENEKFDGKQKFLQQEPGERLDLDKLPFPEYSDFNFNLYRMPNGANLEFSRGCVAKCVFCSETHFWKYRGRKSMSTLDEVLRLNKNYGVDFIWFLDSLVNGNLNELRAFCKGIIQSGVKIKWTGYARCNKKMDYDYYVDLSNSGCYMLSYGIESGSDKVLIDMDKGVTKDEIEQNLEHGSIFNVEAHSNWIVGFPTEELQDVYESLTLIARNNLKLYVVAAGHGFTEPPDTILSQNNEKYGMSRAYYQRNWITKDFTNSKVHRSIRLVAFNIFLHNTPTRKEIRNFANFDTTKYYTVSYETPNNFSHVEYENFDFNIIKTEKGVFANSVMNEIWPLLRLLFRTKGAFKIDIQITPEKVNNEFGDRLGSNLFADYYFEIDKDGNWKAKFDFNFTQDPDPWKYSDYSRETSTSASRARRLAIPESKGEVMWTMDIYKKHMDDIELLKELNFSFTHTYESEGKWQI